MVTHGTQDKSDLNGEVIVLQEANVLLFPLWNTIWDCASVTTDRNGEVTLQVR